MSTEKKDFVMFYFCVNLFLRKSVKSINKYASNI